MGHREHGSGFKTQLIEQCMTGRPSHTSPHTHTPCVVKTKRLRECWETWHTFNVCSQKASLSSQPVSVNGLNHMQRNFVSQYAMKHLWHAGQSCWATQTWRKRSSRLPANTSASLTLSPATGIRQILVEVCQQMVHCIVSAYVTSCIVHLISNR